MKKLLIALVATTLMACSGSDDNDSVNSTTELKFNPPSWIQGTWIFTNPSLANNGYKFTTSDFCMVSYDTSNCLKDVLNQTLAVKQTAKIDEDVTSDLEYTFSYTNLSTTQSFSFKKKSANRVVWISNGSEVELQKK